MSAETVTGAQRALQVHRPPLRPVSDEGAADRGLHGVHAEPALHDPLDRETRAVDGDALALLPAAVGRADPQPPSPIPRPPSPVCGDGVDPAHRVYDSGKHSLRSKTN